MLVAGNKCDLAEDRQIEAFAAGGCGKKEYEFFPLMAAIAHGTDVLVRRCAALLSELPPIPPV